MIIPIASRAVQISQAAGTDCLIVNVGTATVYLDTKTGVSVANHSLTLAPKQSMGWKGGTLWGVCAGGETTSLTLMDGASATMIGSIDANVSGSVAADVTGTVDIGNNVRLWGGGDFLGYKDYAAHEISLNRYFVADEFPAFLDHKYSSLRIAVRLTTGSGMAGILDLEAGSYDTDYRLDHWVEVINAADPLVYDGFGATMAAFDMPLVESNPWFGFNNVTGLVIWQTLRVYVWGSYLPATQPRTLSYYNVGGAGAQGYANTTFASATANAVFVFPPSYASRDITIMPKTGSTAGLIKRVRYMYDPGLGFMYMPLETYGTGIAAGSSFHTTLPASPYPQLIWLSGAGASTATNFLVSMT